jgi:hypothetical protein
MAVKAGFKDDDGELAADGLFEPLWGDDRFIRIIDTLHHPGK